MTKVSINPIQLSPVAALFFISGLMFSPTFSTVSQAIWFCLLFIFRFALILPKGEDSRYGARVPKGEARQFDKLYFYKEALIAVPTMVGAVAFCDGAPFDTLWRFSRTCSLG
jgi:hypothetical protein